MVTATTGIICWAEGWVSIELVGKAKEQWFRTFLDRPREIPAHDLFGQVSTRIGPGKFQASFMDWIQEVAGITAGEMESKE